MVSQGHRDQIDQIPPKFIKNVLVVMKTDGQTQADQGESMTPQFCEVPQTTNKFPISIHHFC